MHSNHSLRAAAVAQLGLGSHLCRPTPRSPEHPAIGMRSTMAMTPGEISPEWLEPLSSCRSLQDGRGVLSPLGDDFNDGTLPARGHTIEGLPEHFLSIPPRPSVIPDECASKITLAIFEVIAQVVGADANVFLDGSPGDASAKLRVGQAHQTVPHTGAVRALNTNHPVNDPLRDSISPSSLTGGLDDTVRLGRRELWIDPTDLLSRHGPCRTQAQAQ